jgi:Lipocalin-like domain
MGLAASQTVVDLEKQLFGVWKLESFYTENKAGERRDSYGARPNGYGILTPEKRMMVIITAPDRKSPITDADRSAAFLSMIAYSGPYRVEAGRFITRVDTSWNEVWTGTEQVRFVELKGDTMTLTSAWQPDPNTPGNPEARIVAAWKRVKVAP